MAEQLHITVDEANGRLAGQVPYQAFAERVMHEPGFVAYRGPFSEDGAQLLVEPGTMGANEWTGGPDGLAIVEAAATSDVRLSGLREAAALGREAAGSSYLSVSYDAFSDEYTIWLRNDTSDQIQRAVGAAIADGVASHPSASVQATLSQFELTNGGRLMEWWSGGALVGSCTTGFGIQAGANKEFLTAGHCDQTSGSWKINGSWVVAENNVAYGGYLDRMRMRTSVSATAWVRITGPSDSPANLNKKMDSGPGHIFFGHWYNHFGTGSNTNRGQEIYDVNVDVKGVWSSVTSANCQYGDSGGPVYYYDPSTNQRHPTGLIHGAENGNGDCAYVALDDQFSGTGWTLLQ